MTIVATGLATVTSFALVGFQGHTGHAGHSSGAKSASTKVTQKSAPKKEHKNAKGQLICPVMGGVVASAAKASGFSDHNGTRYYFCCGGCKPMFDKNPSKYVKADAHAGQSNHGGAKAHDKGQAHHKPWKYDPSAITVGDDGTLSTKVGPYVVEMWPPEDGVFAGEEIDIEFGIFDPNKKDSDGGLVGVDNFSVQAVVTMPSMEGMPDQRPKTHKEGRAGVHGLELFFPHGGEYQIDLTLTPKGGQPLRTTFRVDVKDERDTKTAVRPPYELQVVNFPSNVVPGKPVDLKLRVVDTKTSKPVTNFDVAHEQKFHLLVASKDLSRFMHEHPTMAADGTWTQRINFPAGGDWWVYGDVAPKGKGSRILIQKVKVQGAPPKGKGMAVANMGPSTQGGLTGRIEPLAKPIPIGKMTTLRVLLTDAKTGKPVSDTQPWLGAAGHLMIIHEDGKTVVHSHPSDDPKVQSLVKKGEVHFTGRFPKPGKYTAYSQFQRKGEIKTLGFTLNVK